MRSASQNLVSLLALAACAHFQTTDPPRKSEWDTAVLGARSDAQAGNYYAADKLLAEFMRAYSGTPAAREISFWKAAYLVDPLNHRAGSLADGIATLDAYLADSGGVYRDQAAILRRAAAASQGMPGRATGPGMVEDTSGPSVMRDTAVVIGKSKDEQIAALKDQLAKNKDELAKLNAELDRIKKRLANPSN